MRHRNFYLRTIYDNIGHLCLSYISHTISLHQNILISTLETSIAEAKL